MPEAGISPEEFLARREAAGVTDMLLGQGAFGAGSGGPTAGSVLEFMDGPGKSISGIIGPMLPPEAGRALSIGQPLVTAGLKGLLSEGGFSIGSLLDGGALMGIAGQFLPPQVAEGLSMAMTVASLNPTAIASALIGKFIPPELQGVFSAVQQAGGVQAVMDMIFPPADAKPPKPPDGAGLPAARLTDAHSCPLSDGPKAHVGGPISSGCATVLIGKQPAARVGDVATCVGPPDAVATGESTVTIGGALAARITDTTAHGGKIESGWSTVTIGQAGPSAAEAALAKKCAEAGQESGAPGTTD